MYAHFALLGVASLGVALALLALAQIAMPLRHWAYPGNVRWKEEGYRFAWRVMLTEKTEHVRFCVTDTETGEEWDATFVNRTRRGSGCPYCAGRRVSDANRLSIPLPEVAADWRPAESSTYGRLYFARLERDRR